MDLHNNESPRPAPPNHVSHAEPQPFRLLDLPTEIRLMVLSYAFGYRIACWDLIKVFGHQVVLRLRESYDSRNMHLQHRPLGLLQTCRSISEEALTIIYEQTCFEICYSLRGSNDHRPGYMLRLSLRTSGSARDLSKVILQRVKHMQIYLDIGHKDYVATDILCTYLCRGKWLKSLRFIFTDADFMRFFSEIWFIARRLNFGSYQGTAILESPNANPTDRDIAVFKKCLKLAGHEFPFKVIKKSDISGQRKDQWPEPAT